MFKHFTLCLGLLALAACNTTNIKVPDPEKTTFTEPIKPFSTIAIPINIPLNDITAIVNKQLKQELYADNSFDDNNFDQLKVTVSKRDQIRIEAATGGFKIVAPLHISATYRIQKKIFGKTINHEQPISLNLTAVIYAIPSIASDWKLLLKSTTQLQWDDLPVIEFAGIKVDIPQLFGRIIDNQVQQLNGLIERRVPEQVNLRALVLKQTQALNKPFSLDTATNSWLAMKPLGFFYTPFKTTPTNLTFSIGVASNVEIISGQYPDLAPNTTLPPIKLVQQLNDQVKLCLTTQVSLQTINKLLQQQIAGPLNKFEDKNYLINILEAKAFGNNGKINIGARINGWYKLKNKTRKIKGIIYLEATPFFDEASQSILIKDFDYSLKTQNVLAGSAAWLLQFSGLKNKLAKEMKFNIAKELAFAKQKANETLNNTYANYIRLNGNINKITIPTILFTPTNMRIDIYAEGNINAQIINQGKP